jgi:hypothetical protein
MSPDKKGNAKNKIENIDIVIGVSSQGIGLVLNYAETQEECSLKVSEIFLTS